MSLSWKRNRWVKQMVAVAASCAVGATSLHLAFAEDKSAEVKTDKPASTGEKLSPAIELDQKIMDEIANRSEIMKNLGHISDKIGHRLTGSKSLETANNYAAEVMKSYGLENVKLEPWEIPLGWQRGYCNIKLTSPREMTLLACSAGWQPSTNGKLTCPVVFLDAKKKEDLEKYKGKLKNAIIITSPPSNIPGVKVQGRNPYGDSPEVKPEVKTEPKVDAKPEVKQPEVKQPEVKQPDAKKPEEAQPPRRGFGDTMAFVEALREFIKEEGAAATLRDSGKPHGLLVTTGGWRGTENKANEFGMVSLFVTHEHYAMLYRMAKESPASPPTVELEVKNSFVPGPITVYNTVGEIRGSEKPDEVVVVGAHLDSWDLASGTTDNGTGSSVTLEVARTLATLAKNGQRPKRTIRFCLFTGEEQGLHGSKQYCIRHKDELAKHSAAIVHDTGTGRVMNLGTLGREKVRKILEVELAGLKAVNFEGVTIGGMRGGTDHASFNAQGVPGFACGQDPDEYLFTHHTQSDTFDKAKHPNLIQGAQVIAVTANRIANLAEMLPREKLEEPRRPAPMTEKSDAKQEEKKPEEKKQEEKKPN